MKTGVLVQITAILFGVASISLGDERPDGEKASFPKWAFCVAYQVRDADERDARPVDPKVGREPARQGDTRIPYGIINDSKIVDVAALSTRIVKSGVLKTDAAEGVIRGTTQGGKRHPVMDCYEPHHIFVFYDYDGNPVAAIEVCFRCNRVKMIPEIRAGGGASGSFETADLAGLAKIASEAGLDLKPFESLNAYVQHLEKLAK